MSKYTENFPNLSTYDFDTIMCQLKQVCGADPSGLINAQFLSRPTTAKDIAQLFYCTYYIMQGSENLQKQYVELYTFVKDFFTNLDLQDEVNAKLDEMYNSGELELLLSNHFKLGYALYLGNSYVGGVGSSSGNGIYSLTRDMFYKYDYKASSGCGFNLTTLSTQTFQNLIEEFNSDLSDEEKKSVTHILVFSAMGDSRYVKENNIKSFSGLVRSVKTFVDYCKLHFPNAKVYISFCDTVLNDTINSDTNMICSTFVHECFKLISLQIGFLYNGWIGWNGNRNQYCISSDGYHPNDRGYAELSTAFKEAMEGRYEYMQKQYKYTTSLGNGEFIINANPDIVVISNVKLNAGVEITDGTEYELFDFSDTVGMPIINHDVGCLIRRADNTLVYCRLYMKGNKMYMMSSLTFTTITGTIIPFNLVFSNYCEN